MEVFTTVSIKSQKTNKKDFYIKENILNYINVKLKHWFSLRV